MLLFYIPELQGKIHTLSAEESKHCLKAMRLKIGDELCLTDGHGGLFRAKIIDTQSMLCTVMIEEKLPTDPLPYRLHIAIAPTKNPDRLEWFVEKAVEMGISEISAMVCEHSERSTVKKERIERLMIAAMKQSLQTYLPVFNHSVSFEELIEKYKSRQDVAKLIAYCGQTERMPIVLPEAVKNANDILILIGPEGDFSPREIEKALLAGFEVLTMGTQRLRTETAALMAVATVAACHIKSK